MDRGEEAGYRTGRGGTKGSDLEYFEKSGLMNTRLGQSFLAMNPGMALRTPNLRACDKSPYHPK